MTSDDQTRRHEPRGYIPGAGMFINFTCAKCQKRSPTEGRKMWRKMWVCRGCAKC